MPLDKQNKPETEKPKIEQKPEFVRLPEAEKPSETAPIKETEKVAPLPEKPVLAPQAAVKPPTIKKDPVLGQVENILEENLKEIYLNLPAAVQKKFHDKGDEVTTKIYKMIVEFKAKAKKFLKLIRRWLKLIPGINRFFLEQEAKIKTDKLMMLAKYEEEKQGKK